MKKGDYLTFTAYDKERILSVLEHATQNKSVSIKQPLGVEKYKAQLRINDTDFLRIIIYCIHDLPDGLNDLPDGEPQTNIFISWETKVTPHNIFKHDIWYNGDDCKWLIDKLEEKMPVVNALIDNQINDTEF